LLGGQAALAGTAVLFVMELKRKKGPENIPFSPYIAAGAFGTRVGVRLRWWR
jgi:prepilin signal peptidase PulO-like enzyme (type II secretory pathway)